MKNKMKSSLETLTSDEIEEICREIDEKTDIPEVRNEQVNIRISSEYLKRIQALAKVEGLPYTTFIKKLLLADIDRLWSIYDKTKIKTKKTSA